MVWDLKKRQLGNWSGQIFMFLKLIDGIESRDEQIMCEKGKRKRKEGNEGGEGYIFSLNVLQGRCTRVLYLQTHLWLSKHHCQFG